MATLKRASAVLVLSALLITCASGAVVPDAIRPGTGERGKCYVRSHNWSVFPAANRHSTHEALLPLHPASSKDCLRVCSEIQLRGQLRVWAKRDEESREEDLPERQVR
jgi:hypothetical protein